MAWVCLKMGVISMTIIKNKEVVNVVNEDSQRKYRYIEAKKNR